MLEISSRKQNLKNRSKSWWTGTHNAGLQAEKPEILGFFNFSIIVKVSHNIQLLWFELNHCEYHYSIIMPQSEQWEAI